MKARTCAVLLAMVSLAIGTPTAFGQDTANIEQLKKMYEESLQQLKAAQERKNQLAAENEKLTQQLEAMKKEQAATNARLDELKRAEAEHSDKSFFLRSHYMAWQEFTRANPETLAKWKAFVERDFFIIPRDATWPLDRDWPSSATPIAAPLPIANTQPAATTEPAASALPSTAPTSIPATMPTTQPAATPSTMPATLPVPSPPTQATTVPATRPAPQ